MGAAHSLPDFAERAAGVVGIACGAGQGQDARVVVQEPGTIELIEGRK